MMITDSCPLCGGETRTLKRYRFDFPENVERDRETDEITYECERLLILFERVCAECLSVEFLVDACGSCGFIFLNPRLTGPEMEAKYRAASELESASRRAQKRPALKKEERAARIFDLLSGINRAPIESRRVLDYGGAEGHNLVPFTGRNECFLLDYMSFELPRGALRLGDDVEDLGADDLFDVILLCHTLEHVVEPQAMVDALHAHLAEGGFLYCEVPLGCFREWRVLKEPLTHVNFFGEESLFKCLERAGFQVIHLSTDFHWVLRSRVWCVDIVGRKADGEHDRVVDYRKTAFQMRNPYYYLPLALRKVKRAIRGENA